ncbi:MAG: hypothetical protein NUV46_03025 [Nanoarchaeota archaeon]|nr:hypothetical protein [Nanoarchaeota archaeon]
MGSENERTRLIIKVLMAVVVLLVVIVLYLLVFQTQYNNFVNEKRAEGVNLAVSQILADLQTNGYVQIPVGDEVLILVQYIPPQNVTQ